MTTDKSKVSKEEVKKKSTKKVAKKTTVAKKTKPKKASTKATKTTKTSPKKQITPEERLEMVRTAAYYLAEKRGYHGNYELDDWFEAEKEIDALNNF